MTTPSGLPLPALQFWGAARGAAAGRANTQQFYAALNDAAAAQGMAGHGLSFATVTQLRSAAVQVRNSAEAFTKAPGGSAITADQISVPPYARSLADRNAMPLYHVGINLTTADDEGNVSTDYRTVQFTGQLPPTRDALLLAVQQDAEALADTYGTQYLGHDVIEILAR